jgi:YjzC-like protein
MNSATVTNRYRTGERCETSGRYDFDGYMDGTSHPAPRPEEKQIPLSHGETFPPIRSSGKACYWKLAERI